MFEESITSLRRPEIVIGDDLGQGSFCVVKQILKFNPLIKENNKPVENSDKEHGTLSDEFRFDNVYSLKNDCPQEYVIKSLRRGLPLNSLLRGEKDLVLEAKILSSMSHPNIVNLCAISKVVSSAIETEELGSCPNFLSCAAAEYFLVEERLFETLVDRLVKWKTEISPSNLRRRWLRRPSVFGKGHLTRARKLRHRIKEIWVERMVVAHDVACGINYMHNLDLVYRDLKPDNIGFDANGNVKLFDFGMAKKLVPADKCNGAYRLTGNTGSARYMAPEVSMNQLYDQKVDAYSFGILLWQLCALETPFEGFTYNKYVETVVMRGHRPKLKSSWPKLVVQLMEDCWSPLSQDRPTFTQIESVLKSYLESPDIEPVLNSDDFGNNLSGGNCKFRRSS
mmetsp:Transcript_43958/g.64579  ORF Transcript_43958/g.64579 Transcript_43958/m.64579 type:complete len:395 (-) Transcript_43958:137-1321(-)|eukprot:CAMPEP_0195510956 /NCGR_PEP_ID=MMETSP0794_2-20130614/3443_1 /TAXON_ID=515487 /ORGANISM="Stephanopyxis turris, Strain CCMP 815" /LENGTH=394 /DNA_ID=CAMNT_0040638479 /DNA_START=229 /DNA_END=1413 /DNA_ORIENTATION=-